MRIIRQIGAGLVAIAMLVFTISAFIGGVRVDEQSFNEYVTNNGWQSKLVKSNVRHAIVDKEFTSKGAFSSAIVEAIESANKVHESNQEWGMILWTSPRDVSFAFSQDHALGPVVENRGLFLFLTLGLGVIGGLMFILPGIVLEGPPGIKNHHVYQQKSTGRGWIAYLVFFWLIGFYILLYFYPDLIVNWTFIVQPLKSAWSDSTASQWFLYGVLYCVIMLVMGIRMYVKYRHNRYQIVRTTSVLFFQLVFAFGLIEVLEYCNLPSVDLKNVWPLDYDFLFDWNVASLLQTESYGKMGLFVLVWGVVLALILVPVFVYLFGKRWYCSWVCGCGGLAETLGDPYRQHSSKSLFSWKIERWLVHAVLVFAVLMTAWVGFHSYAVINSPDTANDVANMHIPLVNWDWTVFDIRKYYGFAIGSIFAGVIGTGFYPIFGNRVWCRFGCPLAAYMGIIQRFKSRFRITTNGGQCISCGNCSTYCEQGIDVRWYAQRGQNIVRASCVGCGVCSAVCPRGVLKLENGPEEGRMQDNPIIIGNEGIKLNPEVVES